MTEWAATAVAVGSLAMAGWCLVTALRGHGVGRAHLAGLALVELLVLVHVGYGVSGLAGGHRPREYATFVGYLIAFVLILPVGAGLARLEPTRWGSTIALVACLVDAVLIVRLHQVWVGVG
ncbi:MAG TPA: hypothetical protein VJT31_15645 [Rugosimonospora sp.]|nr:hypothetical protein [Rugosimonospora sp.]